MEQKTFSRSGLAVFSRNPLTLGRGGSQVKGLDALECFNTRYSSTSRALIIWRLSISISMRHEMSFDGLEKGETHKVTCLFKAKDLR